MNKIAAIALCAAALAGCTAMDNNLAGIDPAVQLATAQAQGRQVGYIGPGDSQEYVRAQWGVPSNVAQSIMAGQTWTFWDYNCSGPRVSGGRWLGCADRVMFVDGVVASIDQF